MKLFTSIGLLFLFILCLDFQHTCALYVRRSLKHGKEREARIRTQPLTHEFPDTDVFPPKREDVPCIADDETNLGPFELEGGGGGFRLCTSSVSPPIDLEETALDRKLLGLPGWEYLTVGLVVVAITGIGGAVAIVCKKCGGLFGRRFDKDNTK